MTSQYQINYCKQEPGAARHQSSTVLKIKLNTQSWHTHKLNKDKFLSAEWTDYYKVLLISAINKHHSVLQRNMGKISPYLGGSRMHFCETHCVPHEEAAQALQHEPIMRLPQSSATSLGIYLLIAAWLSITRVNCLQRIPSGKRSAEKNTLLFNKMPVVF